MALIHHELQDSDPPLAVLARRIRERSERMREHDADKVRLAMASSEDLIDGRKRLTEHGTWLTWLRQACDLKQRQALNYVTLAEHRPAVEAYLQRAANLGVRPSIRGALKYIAPDTKPKKPRKLSEIETVAAFGPFLEGHHNLFFEALQLAPSLKTKIGQRLARPLGHKAAKARAKAARELPRAPLVARGDHASIH